MTHQGPAAGAGRELPLMPRSYGPSSTGRIWIKTASPTQGMHIDVSRLGILKRFDDYISTVDKLRLELLYDRCWKGARGRHKPGGRFQAKESAFLRRQEFIPDRSRAADKN